jgi:hypothetical protein
VNWNVYQGYQVYMQSADTLNVSGKEIQPDIVSSTFSTGWNLFSYLRNSAMRADSALSSLGGNLVIAKNNSGQVYWPAFGINQIGDMKPGRGYQMYLSAGSSFSFPANTDIAPPSLLTKKATVTGIFQREMKPEYYTPANGETGSSATLLVEGPDLEDGDEVGVWGENNTLIGSGVAIDERAIVTVWGDNIYTAKVKDGASVGEVLILTLWSKLSKMERNARILRISNGLTGEREVVQLRYKTDAVWIAEVAAEEPRVPIEFKLEQNYPNPFNPSTTIGYFLPKDGRATLEIYNLLGQKISTLLDGEQKAGYHTVVFQANAFSSCVYLYTLRQGEFSATRKLSFIK